MKLRLTLCLALLATSTVAETAKGDEWKTKLESIIRQYQPDAVVTVENDAYVYRYNTQPFKIHSIQKTGAISPTAHDEEGPNVDGILMTVKLEKGAYEGQADIPAVLHRPYWKSFINAYPVSLPGGAHLWMSLSYGSRTDMNLVRDLENCFGDAALAETPTADEK